MSDLQSSACWSFGQSALLLVRQAGIGLSKHWISRSGYSKTCRMVERGLGMTRASLLLPIFWEILSQAVEEVRLKSNGVQDTNDLVV